MITELQASQLTDVIEDRLKEFIDHENNMPVRESISDAVVTMLSNLGIGINEMQVSDNMLCTFVSVWEAGAEYRSPAVYDTKTGHIQVLHVHEVGDLGRCLEQYIEFEDGTCYDVCLECNEYVVDKNGLCHTCDI